MAKLQDYRRKRDFSKTREPLPGTDSNTGHRAVFVVQLHHARRRHFDFRLQMDGVLKSWVVPKGPSYDPTVKRLAVEVEDHPLAYAEFEGDIEHGYGKGHVDQFDLGTWATEGSAKAQLRKGHLRFELFGKRLKGGWHLVRGKRKERQRAWFLIKAKDAYAGDVEADDLLDAKMKRSTRKASRQTPAKATAPAPPKRTKPRKSVPSPPKAPRARLARAAAALQGAQPRRIDNGCFKPELARLREQPPTGSGWLHEVKWDGYRLLAAITDGELMLWSRNALPWTERVPDIAQSLRSLGLHSVRLDGELVALDAQGRSDFNGLQQTLAGEAQWPLVYVLFDLPHLEGIDLSRVRLLERKELLQKLLAHAPDHLAFSTHVVGDGDKAFRAATQQRLEGIVSKRVDVPYRAGRGDDWLKIKRLDADEFAIVGYTLPKGSRSGFGSLLLARPDPQDGSGWIYAGRVGTGFSTGQLRELTATVARKGTAKPTFRLDAIDPLLRDARWLKPKAVAEVYYLGIGHNKLLRQASLKTMRTDKIAADLRDSDRDPQASGREKRNTSKRAPTASKGRASPATDMVVTHPDRVVFPDDAITKQDVADYYEHVMEWFLPGVENRPTSVMRCPEGLAASCFFQKHQMNGLKRTGTVKLKEASGTQQTYLYPRDARSVIELVQFGALEFHPWGATIEHPNVADRLVFDLDPAKDVGWERVIDAARFMRRQLKRLGLASFVRTTGGKGLHVVVPLAPPAPWAQAHAFAKIFAEALAHARPGDFIATASMARRRGRIYVDYLRNSRGATSVASYSLRARSGAPVATPLRWSELGGLGSSRQFDMRTVMARLARLRSDPWEGIDTLQQDLRDVVERLGGKTRHRSG